MKAIVWVALLVFSFLPAVNAFEIEYARVPDYVFPAYGFDTGIGIEPELSDWHATVVIPELGLVERSRNQDSSRLTHVFMGLPYGVIPDEYLVRVQVVHEREDGSLEKHFVHRWIYVE